MRFISTPCVLALVLSVYFVSSPELPAACGVEGNDIKNDALLCAVCDKAYDVAAKSNKGYDVAVQAMVVQMKSVPTCRLTCCEKFVRLRMLTYQRLGRKDRETYGPPYAEAMAMQGAAQADAGLWSEATTSYRRAMAPALMLDASKKANIKQLLDIASAHIRVEKRVAKLNKQLEADPTDTEPAKALALAYLSELNDLEEASSAALRAGDARMLARIKLMTKPAKALTASEALDLGDWCRSLSASASTVGKRHLLIRAHRCYQVFLHQHTTEDLSRTNADHARKSTEATLAKLGVDPPELDESVADGKVSTETTVPEASFDSATARLNEGLLVHWTFDDIKSVLTKDIGKNGHHAKVHGAVQVQGPVGKALYFNGKDQYLETPDLGGVESFTISTWIRFDSTLGQQGEAGKRHSALLCTPDNLQASIHFQTTNGKLTMAIHRNMSRQRFFIFYNTPDRT